MYKVCLLGNGTVQDLLDQVLLLGFPLQIILVRVMYAQRQRCVEVTDSRLQLTTEVSVRLAVS